MYKKEIKLEVLERIKSGIPIKTISEEMKISMPTLYKWEKDIQYEVEEKNIEDEKKASIKIKQLILEKDYKKAKQIGERFQDYAQIQSQMITIAIIEKDYKKAKQIGERFQDDALIQSQMMTITEDDKKYFDIGDVSDTENETILNKIKTSIYRDKIDNSLIEKINNSELLSEYEKTIVLLAICEKKNMLERAKQIQAKSNLEDENQRKEVRKIVERMKSKKRKIFDFGIYDGLLNWKLDEELLEKYKNKTKKQIQNVEEKKSEEESKKEEMPSNKPVQQDVKVEAKNPTKNPSIPIKKVKSEPKIKRESIKVKDTNKIVDKNVKTLKNQTNNVLEYLYEKRTEIYLRTDSTDFELRKNAVKHLDIIQEMIEKVENSKCSDEYMDALYNKVQRLRKLEGNVQGEDR